MVYLKGIPLATSLPATPIGLVAKLLEVSEVLLLVLLVLQATPISL